MDKSDKRQQLAQEWFDSGLSDYQYAKVGLESESVYPQVAFLAQQVAEKYLKGFLVLYGKKLPRIHDLTKLLDNCTKIKPELEELRDICELLTGFYIETRYPPDIPEYTKEEIGEAFAGARKVRETIEELISLS